MAEDTTAVRRLAQVIQRKPTWVTFPLRSPDGRPSEARPHLRRLLLPSRPAFTDRLGAAQLQTTRPTHAMWSRRIISTIRFETHSPSSATMKKLGGPLQASAPAAEVRRLSPDEDERKCPVLGLHARQRHEATETSSPRTSANFTALHPANYRSRNIRSSWRFFPQPNAQG